MNNGKAFTGLDGMANSNLWHAKPKFLPGHWKAKKYWIYSDLQTTNLLEKNNSRYDMKSQIENKKNRSINLWKY